MTLPNYTQSTKFCWLSTFPLSQPYINFLSHVTVFFVYAKHLLLWFNLVVYWVESITILKTLNLMDQPACLEKQKFYIHLQTSSSYQMASPYTCRNFFAAGKDELAGRALSNDSGTPNPTPAVFCTSTLAPAQAPAPTSVSGLPGR